MDLAEEFLKNKINERISNGLFRKLSTHPAPIDFCSNDYLGLARSLDLKQLIAQKTADFIDYKNGATGSRLLAGNHIYTEETEQYIADFHLAESGLIFNSGYDANVGLLSAIPQRGDTIITDELIHASLIDGARLSYAERYKFKHNDLEDLENKLKQAKGLIYVVVESVYSMDGDCAPLIEINALCKAYKANLIVDEAHATGVFGDKGKGLCDELNLTQAVFARIVTFGKALGSHGAIVLGSQSLRTYLINFSRSFIYTTAAPIHQIIAIRSAYELLEKSDLQLELTKKIKYYNNLTAQLNLNTIPSTSAIQSILLGDNESTKALASSLQAKGLEVKAILSPTVARNKERLRICLHTYNSDQEITQLVAELKKY